MTRSVLGLALAAALLVAAPAAGAAERRVPERFVGVMWDGEIQEAPVAVQAPQWAAMAASGVETARVIFSWELAEPRKGRPYRWRRTDTMVEQAALHGIELLPVVHYAPRWARLVNHRASVPRDVDDYTRFVTALVERYGPEGSFWAERPELPRQPLRTWQFWNEPQLHWQFQPHAGWQRRYGKLLRESARAAKRADPGATVVLAGLANRAWDAIAKLYKGGAIRGHFDVAALHMYSARTADFLEILRRFRAALDRQGARDVRIWITEVGASASMNVVIPHPSVRHIQTTHQRMAKMVPVAYRGFVAERERRGLDRVYWYTWSSAYTIESYIFGWSGLNVYFPDQAKVTELFAMKSFRRVARELEGCVKDERARCVE